MPPFFAGDAKPSERRPATPGAEEEGPGPAASEEPSVEVAEQAAGVEEAEAAAPDAGPLFPFDEPGPAQTSVPPPPTEAAPAARRAAQAAEPADAAEPAEPAEPTVDDGQPLPFDEAVLEPAGATAEDEGDDFPVDAFDLPGKGGGAGRSGTAEPPATGSAAGTAPPDFLAPETGRPEAAAPAPGGGAGPDSGAAAAAGEGTARVAALLEELARALRSEGERALSARIASPDRLEGIVAGVLASYFAGRND